MLLWHGFVCKWYILFYRNDSENSGNCETAKTFWRFHWKQWASYKTMNSLHSISNFNLEFFSLQNLGSYNRRSAAINSKLVEKIERMSNLIQFLGKLATSTAIVSPLLTISVNYFIYGLGDESFRFQGTFWLPFDANQVVGFFVASVFECVAIYAAVCFFRPIICIYIGTCWFVVTRLNDTAKDISHLRKRKIASLREQELIKRFGNFVRFHADAEELSGQLWFSCATKCDYIMNLFIILDWLPSSMASINFWYFQFFSGDWLLWQALSLCFNQLSIHMCKLVPWNVSF